MQKNIDIIRWVIRRNVLQAKFQSASLKVENQRPFEIGVAISAHHNYRWSDCLQLIDNCFRANVAEMPDLVCVPGHLPHALRQLIVGVGENEHAPHFFGFGVRNHVAF